jgi:hypothetical protein
LNHEGYEEEKRSEKVIDQGEISGRNFVVQEAPGFVISHQTYIDVYAFQKHLDIDTSI